MTKTRKRYTAAFKAKVALEAIQERKTMSELVSEYGVHSNMIQRRKKEFISRSSEIFETKGPSFEDEKEKQKLFAKMGQLEMEKEWLKKISGRAGI
jgi:transposase-like protein